MGRVNSYANATPRGYSRITVGTVAVGVGAKPSGSNSVTLRVLANAANTGVPAVNIMVTGDTPTASTGMPLWNGDVVDVDPGNLTDAKFISADGLDHVLCLEFNRLT